MIAVSPEEEARWYERAANLCRRAIDAIEDPDGSSDEALISVSAADAALRVALGELPASEMEGYPFPGEQDPLDDLSNCICPPDLVERGGFKGGCPVHAWRAHARSTVRS